MQGLMQSGCFVKIALARDCQRWLGLKMNPRRRDRRDVDHGGAKQ